MFGWIEGISSILLNSDVRISGQEGLGSLESISKYTSKLSRSKPIVHEFIDASSNFFFSFWRGGCLSGAYRDHVNSQLNCWGD